MVGNHDVKQWPEYERLITAHQDGISGARCTGRPGLSASCVYRGVQLVMSEIGTLGKRVYDEAFIKNELEKSRSPWKLCLWHKTQHDMQVGAKQDEVGWVAYQACQAAGAIVVTGHEHSYARSRTLTAIGDMVHGHGAVGPLNKVEVGPGRTFVAVSGLGGIQTRKFDTSHIADGWWGAYFTADRQIVNGEVTRMPHEKDGVGALFLDLGAEGDMKRGRVDLRQRWTAGLFTTLASNSDEHAFSNSRVPWRPASPHRIHTRKRELKGSSRLRYTSIHGAEPTGAWSLRFACSGC